MSDTRRLRLLKFLGVLALHTLLAVIGTGVLELTLNIAYRPQSITALNVKTYVLSVVCATAIGFLARRTWRTNAANWVWVPTTLWFAPLFVLTALASPQILWREFSGSDCVNGSHSLGCVKFLVFTITFIRGISYSAGAYICSWAGRNEAHPVVVEQTSAVSGSDAN